MPFRAAKRVARRAIGTAAPWAWRRVPGPQLVVLTYHRVLPDGHPDRATEQPGMYVRPETLAMHLDTLRRHFEFVHLEDWLADREAGRPLPRLACAITFDDGWRDNYLHGWSVLESRGVPFTVFLVTQYLGGQYSFWPNRLARQLGRTDQRVGPEAWPGPLRATLEAAGAFERPQGRQPGPEVINRAVMACKRFTDAQVHCWLDLLPPLQSVGRRDLLDLAELQAMAAGGLARFGSHTRRHTRLAAGIDRVVIEDEVGGSADDLELLIGRRPLLFCYPNGDHSLEALQSVRRRYLGAASTVPGWNEGALDAHLIRRVGVHEDIASTPTEFMAILERARWRSV
jgi:peptidoglycan/xylan/chitin deacetylase (PgdA/CDA1 family)